MAFDFARGTNVILLSRFRVGHGPINGIYCSSLHVQLGPVVERACVYPRTSRMSGDNRDCWEIMTSTYQYAIYVATKDIMQA